MLEPGNLVTEGVSTVLCIVPIEAANFVSLFSITPVAKFLLDWHWASPVSFGRHQGFWTAQQSVHISHSAGGVAQQAETSEGEGRDRANDQARLSSFLVKHLVL